MSIPQVADLVIDTHSENGASLDLFSIKQSEPASDQFYAHPKCINNAPFFAYQTSEKGYAVVQGNCHSWSCPRCGIGRAKQEYGRIVEGCRTLASQHEIYFITLTCRGKEMSLEDSEKHYYEWTNRLFSALRYRARKEDKAWHYVQVTERQKRGHPHSHVLTTFYPHDLYDGFKESWITYNGKRVKQLVPALRSDWLEERCISAGLGNQYDISKVETVEGASRYVAKYMFKDSMFAEWPKNWHRIRYSRSFPKLEKEKSDAFVLLKDKDWYRLAELAVVVKPTDAASETQCLEMLRHHDVIVRQLEGVS